MLNLDTPKVQLAEACTLETKSSYWYDPHHDKVVGAMLGMYIFYWVQHEQLPGGRLNKKTVLPGMAIPMLKIRRPNGRLIFNMEIAICW